MTHQGYFWRWPARELFPNGLQVNILQKGSHTVPFGYISSWYHLIPRTPTLHCISINRHRNTTLYIYIYHCVRIYSTYFVELRKSFMVYFIILMVCLVYYVFWHSQVMAIKIKNHIKEIYRQISTCLSPWGRVLKFGGCFISDIWFLDF